MKKNTNWISEAEVREKLTEVVYALAITQEIVEAQDAVIKAQKQMIEGLQGNETIYKQMLANYENIPSIKRAKAEYLARHKPRQVFIKSDVGIKSITSRAKIENVRFVPR